MTRWSMAVRLPDGRELYGVYCNGCDAALPFLTETREEIRATWRRHPFHICRHPEHPRLTGQACVDDMDHDSEKTRELWPAWQTVICPTCMTIIGPQNHAGDMLTEEDWRRIYPPELGAVYIYPLEEP